MTQHCSRKRGRSNCEEECCVPLSKRINNLHINNGACCNTEPWRPEQPVPRAHENNFGDNVEQWAASSSAVTPNVNGQVNFATDSSQQHRYLAQEPATWPANHGPPYNPDLDATDNPYYYNTNKLLYELYIARLQRGGLL